MGKKLGVVHAPVIPAMAESLKQEDHGPDLPRQNVKPFLQNN
jgi:hypothetical protein